MNNASRIGVTIPLYYTLTMYVRDEKIRFTYKVGGPVESSARGPFESDMDDMQADFQAIQTAVLAAIETEDDF